MRKRIFLLILVLATAFALFTACAVLSSDTSLTVESVCDEAVENNAATLTTAQYEALVVAQDKVANIRLRQEQALPWRWTARR